MNNNKILVIEDDRDMVEIIRLCFQKYWPEAELTIAYLGLEGLEMITKDKIDTIILDLGLPDINSFEVLRQLRLVSQVPVATISVIKEDYARIRAFEFGADAYITKPFSPKELIFSIRSLRLGSNRGIKRNSLFA